MSERDKWGRIPVKLVEVDQDFCMWEFGELPCQAGPQSNIQIQSREFGENALWTSTGGGGAGTFAGFDNTYGLNFFVLLDPTASESVTIAAADRVSLPVLNSHQIIYMTFIFDPAAGSDGLEVKMVFTTPSGETKIGFTLDSFNLTTSAVDAEVNDITFTTTSDPSFTERVSFWVDTSDLFAEGDAFNVFTEFTAATGTDFVSVALPQLSLDELSDYRQTDEDPIFADDTPCFNTLSSCRAPQTYVIEGSRDGLFLEGDSKSMTYSSLPSPVRQEGIFLEFYFSFESGIDIPAGDSEIIDVGGELSFILRSGTPEQFVFSSAGGAEIAVDIPDGVSAYRLAAFLSTGGVLSVRDVSESSSGTGFSTIPDSITINDTTTPTTDGMGLSDVLLYGYEAKDLNDLPRLDRDRRKGDLFGDAFFHAKFNRNTGLESESGISPTGDFTTDNVTSSALLNILAPQLDDGFVVLNPYGETKLLEEPLILRFSERRKSSRLPETLSTIPSLIDASNKPAELQVGGTNENIGALGSRDELVVTWEDHPYSDIQTDPYLDQRTYTPEDQGTFWGKWIARNVYKQGFPVRYVSGYELPSGGLERTHAYNYILDKVDGPTSTGKVTGKAFDILQDLRSDKAVYPAANTGRLSAGISDTATTLTMEPVGIGDDEYPASFRCRIGGEGFDVTRSGDVLTFDGTSGTQRGLYGGAESHSADDVVQIVAQLSDQVHDIAYTIITTAVPKLAGNIPKDKWDGLADNFLPRIYSADITEPTGVEDLLGELVATAPIYFYADVRTNLIELGVIREPSSVAIELREDQELIADSVNLKEYPKERIDEVWVYYRIRDAAGDIEDEENYSQRFILINAEEQGKRGRRSIRRIYTRWLEGGGPRDTAEELAQAYISRFQNQPIRVSFDLDARQGDIWLGDVAALVSRQKQTITGEKRDDLNYQVIRAQESSQGHKFTYIAQSYEFFSPVNPDAITITILPENNLDDAGDVDQINLRELYDATVATEIDDITFVIAGGPVPSGGTVVGGGTAQTWSLRNPNDWSWSPTIAVRVEPGGVIAGRGGNGGDGGKSLSINGENGGDGQTGFLVEYATTINNFGIIGGGGGGGGGSGGVQRTGAQLFGGPGGGGGGGRISVGGAGNANQGDPGEAGTFLEGGDGGPGEQFTLVATATAGSGGDLGQSGTSGQPGDLQGQSGTEGTGGTGGSPGNAIDGVSFVTYTTRGDIRGNEV